MYTKYLGVSISLLEVTFPIIYTALVSDNNRLGSHGARGKADVLMLVTNYLTMTSAATATSAAALNEKDGRDR